MTLLAQDCTTMVQLKTTPIALAAPQHRLSTRIGRLSCELQLPAMAMLEQNSQARRGCVWPWIPTISIFLPIFNPMWEATQPPLTSLGDRTSFQGPLITEAKIFPTHQRKFMLEGDAACCRQRFIFFLKCQCLLPHLRVALLPPGCPSRAQHTAARTASVPAELPFLQ